MTWTRLIYPCGCQRNTVDGHPWERECELHSPTSFGPLKATDAQLRTRANQTGGEQG